MMDSLILTANVTDEPESYEYSRLGNAEEFRIMELYPGFRSQPLVCHMISVSLDQAPQFEALSYTWGQSFERFTLYQEPKESNGLRTSKSILKITRGLYEALMQLRTPSGSRMLWVDAICIDQENWKERGEQVRIMRQIYTRAAHVLVWLGLEDEQTPAALQAVAKLKTHITSRGLSFATLKSMKDEDSYADMLGLSKDLLDTESAASLRQLYRRPWFERMWIVQEVTAGASSSEVHIGPHAIPWDDLGMAALWLEALHWHSYFPSTAPGFQRNALVMWQGRLLGKETTPPLLDEARSYLASDPRDKVYALYGFSAFQQLFEDFGFTPDYTISVQELYKLVTLLAIKSSKTLEILHYIDHLELTEEDSEWPSWVPRWDKPTLHWSFPLQDYEIYNEKTYGVLSLLDEPQGNILRLKGILLGPVIKVAQYLDWTTTQNDIKIQNPEALTQFWDTCFQHEQFPSYDSKMKKFTSLAHALTAGLDASYNSTSRNSGSHTADAIAFLLHSLTTTTATPPSDTTNNQPPSPFHTFLLALQNTFPHGNRHRYQQDIVWLCKNRRLFYTTKGCFGLGPLDARSGDVAAILFGGHMPFVLRPRDGYFQLLGECYLGDGREGKGALDIWGGGGGGSWDGVVVGEGEEMVFELR